MAEVNVTHDAFVAALQRHEAHVSKQEITCYWCDFCGCIFLANTEGSDWYPDRFEMVGVDGDGCCIDCNCHAAPYMMDKDGNPTEF